MWLVLLNIFLIFAEKKEDMKNRDMKQKVKYGIGQQSFEDLRRDDCIYVDKTEYIVDILSSGTRYYFLGRPRRFGKSLLLSTIKCFFEGKRELFQGLYIDSMPWDWEEWPVIYIDLNRGSYSQNVEELEEFLDKFLTEQEARFGMTASTKSVALRFADIIQTAHEKTGKQVVILVDEYDKPLVNNINNPELFEQNRILLSNLYSNFKSSAEHLRLVFLTGVSAFGKLSVFSSLNNINDISFDEDYSAICGITEDELVDSFQEGISVLGEANELNYEETLSQLKSYYDGYHFGKRSLDIYNPYSLLNVMQKRDFYCYWVQSGTPTLLAQLLKKSNANLEEILHCKASRSDLSKLDVGALSVKALLYQTGYLTIKSYDREYDLFILGIPNQEVKVGFLEFLLPSYSNIKNDEVASTLNLLITDFKNGNPDGVMRTLQTLFAGYGNTLGFGNEENVRNAMMIICNLLGVKINAEYATSNGRIDLLIETDRFIYIIELKFDKSAAEALQQIHDRQYARPFQLDTKQLFKIGANFSSSERTLSEWLIEG